MSTDRSLLDEFINESKEHLSTIEDDFISLEKNGASADPELVNRIFRAMHTIKGSAGFFGLTNISQLSHAMETIMSMVRDGTLVPNQSHIDVLLQGVDTLSSLIDDIDAGNDRDLSDLQALLTGIIDGNSPSGDTKTSHQPVSVGRDEYGNEFNVSRALLKSLQPEQRYLYRLEYDLSLLEKKDGLNPIKIVKQLQEIGRILDGYLTGPEVDLRDGMPGQALHYHVLYATVIDPELITTAVNLDEKYVRQIKRDDLRFADEKQGEAVPEKEKLVPETDQKGPKTASPNSDDTSDETAPEKPVAEREHKGSGETVRVRLDVLDQLMLLAGELVLVRNRQLMQMNRADAASRTITQRLDVVTSELQETVMRTRMQPIGNIFGKFNRIVRDLGKKLGKKIEIHMSGEDVELDKTILEAITDPLTHIVRNSCDHGIEHPADRVEFGKREVGRIRLRAYHEAGQINIEISDDGKGIDLAAVRRKVLERKLRTEEQMSRLSDKEALNLVFLPGLSTSEEVSDLSGRGVGMDVVKTQVEKLGGIIEMESSLGHGTRIFLRLPLTLAIIPSLIVQVGKSFFAIPQVNLEEVVCLYDDDIRTKIECAGSREVYRLRSMLLPIVHLSEVLARPEPFTDTVRAEITEYRRDERVRNGNVDNGGEGTSLKFAVIRIGAVRYGLVIDGVVGTEEIVVKPMHRAAKQIGIYSGATVLGDGNVALILDTIGVARHAAIRLDGRDDPATEESTTDIPTDDEKMGLLLFRCGEQEQFAVETAFIRRVERIEMQSIERTGSREFITIGGTPTRVVRLDRHMDVSPLEERPEMFLLLPRESEQPYGVLISELIDVGYFGVRINTRRHLAPGLDGSAVVYDRLTLLLNMGKIIRQAAPEWYDAA